MRNHTICAMLAALLLSGCAGPGTGRGINSDGPAKPSLATRMAGTGAVELDRNGDGKIDDELVATTLTRDSELAAVAASKQNALLYTPENAAAKGVAGGYAELDGGGKLPLARIPDGVGGGVTSYEALSDKPTIPDALADLAADASHRVVTDAEKAVWNAKQSPLTVGTDYLSPNGSAAGLTGFPLTLATDLEVASAVSGKLSDAESDSKTYGRKDSAWVEVLNAADIVTFTAISPLSYNPVTGASSINLATDLSATIAANDSVPSALAVKTYIKSLPKATGPEPTKVTSDPTAANADGWYQNLTSGHWWYVDADGLSDVSAGTYTAWDTTPTAFGWGSITGAIAGDTYCYGTPYVVAGINRTAVITATGEATYKINGGSATSSAGTVAGGDSVVPCLSVSTPGSTTTGNLIIGGVTGSPAFSVTTINSVVKAYETETFTASNNVALTAGGLWTEQVAPNGTFYDYLRVYNNVVVAAANRTGSAYRSNVAFSPNQKACATVVIAGTGGPGARMSTTVGDDSGYSVFADTANKYLLRTLVHGSATSLLSPDVTMTAGDVVCVSSSGDNPVLVTMSVSRGGSSIYSDTYPDSSANRHITGQPGMRLRRATYDVRYDNWTGEDL